MNLQVRKRLNYYLISHAVDLILLEPLHRSLGEPDPAILRLEIPGPYYQWWRLKEAHGGPTGRVQDIVYEGVHESLDYVKHKVNETLLLYGRFDGFLGFSQGAVCSLLVTMAHLTVRPLLYELDRFHFTV